MGIKKIFSFNSTIVTITLIVSTTMLSIIGIKYGDVRRELSSTNTIVESQKETINNFENKTEKYQSTINDLKIQLKTTPVDTTGDVLLEKHIFVYIDKKFQLVPRTASKEIAKQIIVKAREANVSPELVVGIIEVESAFDASAVSSANARGLMQVMPEWARKFGLSKVSHLHDIDTGIECGIKVLKIHIEEEGGNLKKGLFKYVGGSDAYTGKVFSAIGRFVAYRSNIELKENLEKIDAIKS